MADQKHVYPSEHGPGTHWATDVTWLILDTLPPGLLSGTQRAYISGLFAGALVKASQEGKLNPKDLEPMPRLRREH